jgi:cytoskeletal protein CcmA (bactofilin family)
MVEKERPAGQGDTNVFLAKGCRISGKINCDGLVRIDGEVEGEVLAPDTLVVGESAVLTAQIKGGTVIIHGKVTGDVIAAKRVEIRAPGKLYGNIVTPCLVIHEGVLFEGNCSMAAAETRADQKVTVLFANDERGDGTFGAPPAKD